MSLFSKLFGGGGSQPKAESETYKGFTITPTPISEGSRYRLSAMIEKQSDGETKTHTLIRADMFDDLKSANDVSLNKARQMVDEQGDRLFS